jgi:hypothetical protein
MHSLILAIWTLLAPGAERFPDAGRIADAIEAATGGDERLASVMATYAWKESNLRPVVVGDGGRSCGTWQQDCRRIAGLSIKQHWLRDVQASSLAAVNSSPSRAAHRARLAMALLERVKAVP